MGDARGGLTEWPALPYTEWRPTRDTLHMYTQVIGKLRLALSPYEPEWANVPLYVTARGLTTTTVPFGLRTFDAEFDLLDHALVLRSSDGQVERLPLGGSVADFYRDVMAALRRMDIEVVMHPVPSDVNDPIPFAEDRTHDTYVAEHAARFFAVLSMVDVVMKEHHAAFRGRSTPVHFFWGSFDLAITRYSGRPAQPAPGAGVIARGGQDAEQICAGWWPGDERLPEPGFFAYGYPPPDGVDSLLIQPDGASWSPAGQFFLLPYDVARSAADPSQAIRDFLSSTYAGLARLLAWDDTLTRVQAPTSTGPSDHSRRTPHGG